MGTLGKENTYSWNCMVEHLATIVILLVKTVVIASVLETFILLHFKYLQSLLGLYWNNGEVMAKYTYCVKP